MGKLVIFLTTVLFLFFVIKQSRHFFKELKKEKIGYCLVVDKYEVEGRYILVFQQGQQEWALDCPYKIYQSVPVLSRGSLTLYEKKFDSFEF
ncbi:hypothetical protein [Enterococcus sp.]|uniref:hypothetical protein n=1 Tax=Enterococcus sp. TaxID=35783 RepID=UPI002FCAE674